MSSGSSLDYSDDDMGEQVMNGSLDELQSEEQRKLLDTVSHMRKCGLDTDLPLPQIAVCGDQSAGKSSVLEALTEISFPSADNLCTRFATEITMRRAAVDSLTIRIVPDSKRPTNEQERIKQYHDSIKDFNDLPKIMERAKSIMGISDGVGGSELRAFARDVLSIEIEGPTRIQLTVVDLPGLIQNKTKAVTERDVELVRELTQHYISQPRTICLAVITATNDYANQGILTMVKAVDPNGDRSLGVITKPDRLHPGSGSERSFLDLAKNEDVFFKLGWHVLKNRGYEDSDGSFMQRNLNEQLFFQSSNFKTLPADSVGIEALRCKLAHNLFEHIKRELPRLCDDLKSALTATRNGLSSLGKSRITTEQCRSYLFGLGEFVQQICKTAINGTYEGAYFFMGDDEPLSPESRTGIRRLRALVQKQNEDYASFMRKHGHSFHFVDENKMSDRSMDNEEQRIIPVADAHHPKKLSKEDAIKWVQQIMDRSRGRELSGNFNPLVIGDLFWRQTEKWQSISQSHLENIAALCSVFFRVMLEEYCAKDILARLWARYILDALTQRERKAEAELSQLITDLHEYPLNYNHYYTETIAKLNGKREEKDIIQSLEAAVVSDYGEFGIRDPAVNKKIVDINKAVRFLSAEQSATDLDMVRVSCKEALVCMRAIYKVKSKQFVANVTEQVIERHLIRNLDSIFSPMVVSKLTDQEIKDLASEPATIRRQRQFYEERLAKLMEAEAILKSAMGSTGSSTLPNRIAAPVKIV